MQFMCVYVYLTVDTCCGFFFTVVEEPFTAFKEVNDSRSVHFTVTYGTSSPSSYKEFLSENALVDDIEPDLIGEDLSSYNISAVNPSPLC